LDDHFLIVSCDYRLLPNEHAFGSSIFQTRALSARQCGSSCEQHAGEERFAIDLGFGNKQANRGVIVMVSGNNGEYYSPYYIANAVLSMATQEY
jgi:hypothetical protein